MSFRWSVRPLLVLVASLALVIGGQLAGVEAAGLAPSGGRVVLMVAAKKAAVLVVAPGRIGSLRMGTKTRRAKKAGWITWERPCGWEAGRKAYRLDSRGNEVYKAYPDEVKRGRVLSMHAMGVVTTLGVHTSSLGEFQSPGSTLTEVQAAYPGLLKLGSWRDYVTDTDWPVYTTGDPKQGWLDFYLDPGTLTVNFVQARTNAVQWGEPMFEC